MSASLAPKSQKDSLNVPYAYSPHDVLHSAQPLPTGLVPIYRLIFPAVCAHTSLSKQKSSRDVPYAYSPRNFLHSVWPLYLSLPRNQCMTMINERIACPEISKGFIERTLRVQSPWCFILRAASASQSGSNLQINFSGSLHTYRMLHIKKFPVHTIRIQSQELFLHSAWPLYLSLPRNQCMTMIDEHIACPEISKGFIERTLHVQSRWFFYTPRSLCLQFTD